MLISYFRIISNLQQGTTFCISLVFKLQTLPYKKMSDVQKPHIPHAIRKCSCSSLAETTSNRIGVLSTGFTAITVISDSAYIPGCWLYAARPTTLLPATVDTNFHDNPNQIRVEITEPFMAGYCVMTLVGQTHSTHSILN
jgi:hypothetical protein